MRRFGKIPSLFEPNHSIPVIDYHQKTDFDDTFITDTSGYVPNKQAVQVLNRQFAMSMMEQLAFDLPSEIKADAVNLFARRKNVDIAELSQHQMHLKGEIERILDDARKKFARRHAQKKDSPVPPPSPDKKDVN